MKPIFCLVFCLVALCRTSDAAEQFTPSEITLSPGLTFSSNGGYRFKIGTYGSSRVAYSNGRITFSPTDNLLYISGHGQHFSVGAYLLNTTPKHGDVSDFPIVPNGVPFAKITPNFTPTESANTITGLEVLDDSLLVMTDEYYDADEGNLENLIIFEDRLNLKESPQNGYFTLEGSSHVAGWIAKVPYPIAKDIRGIYLAGSASNLPINNRHSQGPTLFTWFPLFMGQASAGNHFVNTERLIDYSMENPLHDDLKNKSGDNDLWTELSTAVYGFISPDQKYYVVIGTSGGHNSEIGYKIVQTDGSKCGGICAADPSDYYNYYWVYTIDDILKSKRGEIKPHEIKPSHYGKIDIYGGKYLITGADYSPEKKKLFLVIDDLDNTQSNWEAQPALLEFSLVR